MQKFKFFTPKKLTEGERAKERGGERENDRLG
jgi:hypothetical protein